MHLPGSAFRCRLMHTTTVYICHMLQRNELYSIWFIYYLLGNIVHALLESRRKRYSTVTADHNVCSAAAMRGF